MGEFTTERQSGGILSAREEGQRVGFLFTEIRIGIQIKYRRPIKCRRTCGQRLPIDRAKGPVDLDHDIAAADFDAIRQAQHDPAAQLRSNGQVGPVVRARLLVCRDDRHPEAPARCLEAGGVAGVEGGYFGREGTPHSSEQVHVVQFKHQQGRVLQILTVAIGIYIDNLA